MSNTNHSIFTGLKIVAWVIFIGLCFEAGSLVLNFIFSLTKPEDLHRLYHDLDLTELLDESRWGFFSIYSFILSIAIVKAYLFYLVTQLMQNINLSNPFNRTVSKQISQISYYTLSVGLLSYLGRYSHRSMIKRGFDLPEVNQYWSDSQAFVIMASVVYVISVIFSKGVEFQEEVQETV